MVYKPNNSLDWNSPKMLAFKVILGLCMVLLVQAETDKLNVIRALSNDQVIYPINLTEIDQLNYFKNLIEGFDWRQSWFDFGPASRTGIAESGTESKIMQQPIKLFTQLFNNSLKRSKLSNVKTSKSNNFSVKSTNWRQSLKNKILLWTKAKLFSTAAVRSYVHSILKADREVTGSILTA